jgi:hypothetical protein
VSQSNTLRGGCTAARLPAAREAEASPSADRALLRRERSAPPASATVTTAIISAATTHAQIR